jgi:hypothetical protein
MTPVDRQYLQLLRLAPFQRGPRGWRFGTRPIYAAVLERLLADGRIEISGDQVTLARKTA